MEADVKGKDVLGDVMAPFLLNVCELVSSQVVWGFVYKNARLSTMQRWNPDMDLGDLLWYFTENSKICHSLLV